MQFFITNIKGFELHIKISTPTAKKAVEQNMYTDNVESVIARLESIIAFLKRQYGKEE